MRRDEPAFPLDELQQSVGVACQHFGLTVREYIAIEAMKGIMTMIASGAHRTSERGRPHLDIAEEAFNMADAMLTQGGIR